MSRYRFGEFTLDMEAFDLRRQDQPIRLERRPFDLLVMLVRQPGRLVPRDELVAALWPSGVIIDFDAGLNTLVRKVRAALGDSPEAPRFVETVPGRGYRFIAAVETDARSPTAPTAAAVPDSSGVPLSDPRSAPRDDTPPPAAARRATPRWLALGGALCAIAILIGAYAWRSAPSGSGPTRIAVLPFETRAGDEQVAYLASGLAEDTSVSLARIDPANLRVVGAATRVDGDQAGSLASLGKRLGVDLIVSSSLRANGARIRVTSRLLRVRDGEQLWSAAFDRELTDVLTLQRELSTAIAEQVRLRLSPEITASIRRWQTENPAAYALYLQGRYEWSRLTRGSTRRALELYTQATTMDPSYGLAWAEKAFAAASSLRTIDADPAVATPIARAALARALQLAPDLAQTQYARGYVALFCDLDPATAEAAAREAVRLDPNNSQAHMLLGVALSVRGEMTEGREMLRRSRELDPLFALAFANSAMIAIRSGDPQGGLEFARQSVAIDPEFWVGHYYIGQARERLGDLPGAEAALLAAARYSDGHSITYRARVDLLMRMGRIPEVRALLAEMEARRAEGYFPALALAETHALLHEDAAALEWLERAITERDLALNMLGKTPAFAALKDDPRFRALVARCRCAAARARKAS